jgi:hypothetical protein
VIARAVCASVRGSVRDIAGNQDGGRCKEMCGELDERVESDAELIESGFLVGLCSKGLIAAPRFQYTTFVIELCIKYRLSNPPANCIWM